MPLEPSSPGEREHKKNPIRKSLTHPEDASLMEILDRVLDHGIVIDPSAKIRLVASGKDTAEEHLVVDPDDTQA